MNNSSFTRLATSPLHPWTDLDARGETDPSTFSSDGIRGMLDFVSMMRIINSDNSDNSDRSRRSVEHSLSGLDVPEYMVVSQPVNDDLENETGDQPVNDSDGLDDETGEQSVNNTITNVLMRSYLRTFIDGMYEIPAPVYTINYTSYNMSLAKSYINMWCISEDDIPDELVKLVVELQTSSSSGDFPSIDNIADYMHERRCFCLHRLPDSKSKSLIKHFLINHGRASMCIETRACIEFECFHQRWPNKDELHTTIQRTLEFSNNAEEFHVRDKLYVPTPNLAHLKAEQLTDENADIQCFLCLENIETKQYKYVLKPCNHVFHSNTADCLVTCNILTWLTDHRTCPVCRQSVVVERT